MKKVSNDFKLFANNAFNDKVDFPIPCSLPQNKKYVFGLMKRTKMKKFNLELDTLNFVFWENGTYYAFNKITKEGIINFKDGQGIWEKLMECYKKKKGIKMKDLYKYYLTDNCAFCGKKITKKMLNNQEVLKLYLRHSLNSKGSDDDIWAFKFCNKKCFNKGIKILLKESWLK